jgi:competence protein ComEA
MSFYRTLLAAVAAVVIASPVFAEDTSATTTTEQTTTTTTTEATSIKVNINTATAKDLMKVKGLNAAKARAIVAYRKKNGDFKTLDDLTNVKGFKKVKPDTLKTIQEQLSVE